MSSNSLQDLASGAWYSAFAPLTLVGIPEPPFPFQGQQWTQMQQIATVVTIASSNTAPTTNEAVTFTGEVLDQNGAIMAYTPVYLFANGVAVASGSTDAVGNYSIPYTFSTAGTYSVNSSTNANNT